MINRDAADLSRCITNWHHGVQDSLWTAHQAKVQVAAVSTVKGFLEMHLRTALYDPMQPVTLSYAQSS